VYSGGGTGYRRRASYLHEAISAGYRDLDKLSLDADLQGMRDNPNFQQLVADLKAPSVSVVRP
jgi:hypothetical protein